MRPINWTPPAPDYPEYATLLAAAQQAARRFVDPRTVRLPDEIVARRGYDWAAGVLGKPWRGVGYHPSVESALIKAADTADVRPPLPQWLIDDRAEAAEWQAQLDADRAAARQRDVRVWTEARERCAVKVEVRQNQTARVRGGYRQRLGHAVPLADALSGTRRRHQAGRALCETSSRQAMRLGEPVDEPATCVRCLDWTSRVRAADRPARTTGSYSSGGAS